MHRNRFLRPNFQISFDARRAGLFLPQSYYELAHETLKPKMLSCNDSIFVFDIIVIYRAYLFHMFDPLFECRCSSSRWLWRSKGLAGKGKEQKFLAPLVVCYPGCCSTIEYILLYLLSTGKKTRAVVASTKFSPARAARTIPQRKKKTGSNNSLTLKAISFPFFTVGDSKKFTARSNGTNQGERKDPIFVQQLIQISINVRSKA